MSASRPMSLSIVVIILLVAGGFMFWTVRELAAELRHDGAYGLQASPAIISAASGGDLAGIERETKKGSDINALLPSGGLSRVAITPLMAASMNANAPAVRKLLELGASLETRSSDGRTAIIYAAGWGNAETINALLDKGARVDARGDDGWTATMLAAARGDLDRLRALLNAGANVDARNKWGQTALFIAAQAGSMDRVKALLDAGARATIDWADNSGATPVAMAAAAPDSSGVLSLLLAAGADPNLTDNDGLTPLMRAADRGDVESIKALLAAKADTSVKDRLGRTARDWAQSRDDALGRAAAELLPEQD
ncbi:MAG: ankyrin repeat domain-containing protein [Phycisphaeraceae bacterium]|nr:ankyrin repeat domain-containing protein [Phycisphaeraceae bacterium]QYK47799.1 MAG: ankyrin repeat domain-containing protein [Phycisphaeraceae bacterium]